MEDRKLLKMQREILFRGLDAKGKWHYGDLRIDENGCRICYTTYIAPCMSDPWGDCRFEQVQVDIDTVGQFTCFLTKSDKKIFEDDILGGYPHGTGCVEWDLKGGCWLCYSLDTNFDEDGEPIEVKNQTLLCDDLNNCFDEWEVIGNIHQHKELLTD